jgi:hypothetical protein
VAAKSQPREEPAHAAARFPAMRDVETELRNRLLALAERWARLAAELHNLREDLGNKLDAERRG